MGEAGAAHKSQRETTIDRLVIARSVSLRASTIHSPPIQPDNPSAALQAPSAHDGSLQPVASSASVPTGQHPSRTSRLKHLLNPSAERSTNAQDSKCDADRMHSSLTATTTSKFKPAVPLLPPDPMREHHLEDFTLPPIKTASTSELLNPSSCSTISGSSTSHVPYLVTNDPRASSKDLQQAVALLPGGQASPSVGSGAVLPPAVVTAPRALGIGHTPLALSPQLSPGAPSTILEASHQSSCQMMTLQTVQGPILVPLDTQVGFKVADEKRKRNATASHRFRQRRKEKERETADNISKLEAQVRELTEKKEYYEREREFLQDMILQYHIHLPSRPPSPRRMRQALIRGLQAPDIKMPANTRNGHAPRSTNTYITQCQPLHTAANHIHV